MRKASHYKLGGTSREECISFEPVTLSELAEIDDEPRRIGEHVKIGHYADQNLLVVKLMPSVLHQVTHRNFCDFIRDKCVAMELAQHKQTYHVLSLLLHLQLSLS